MPVGRDYAFFFQSIWLLIFYKRMFLVSGWLSPVATVQVAGHISKAFQTAGINPEQEMNQIAFVEAFKKVVISVAQSMRQQPLTVAHTEKVFDGSSITSLLKDRQSLDLVCPKPSLSWFCSFFFLAAFFMLWTCNDYASGEGQLSHVTHDVLL